MRVLEEALGALLVLVLVGVYCYAVVSSTPSLQRKAEEEVNKPSFGIPGFPDLTPMWEYLKRQANALERIASAAEALVRVVEENERV